ncbi:hypothetical protein DSO57_1002402 [Entomophthora muscae]|uniref:Uncharacterized protein n=1 Tax=Entomophthora muscae TaxID=34485 RepID=A0ACC2SAN2_9FUNG|nr:hypothetical protein DSO57_1002402 [Entomophthora muscae]
MSVSDNIHITTQDITTEGCSASQEAASVPDVPVLPEAVAQNPDAISSESEVAIETKATLKEQVSLALTDEDKKFILKQVGFYFSDINLPYDKFLREKVSSGPEGFVDLTLILTFKKMQPYKEMLEQVAEVLRSSEELVVSEDGLKIRRLTMPSSEPISYMKQHKSTLAFKGVPEENKDSFLDRFFEFLRAILTEAFAGSGVSIVKYFARIQNNFTHYDPESLKTYTLIGFAEGKYAKALYDYFQSVPCVFDSVPLQVFTRYELMITAPDYVTPFPADKILKVVGVSKPISTDDATTIRERLGNTIWHISFPKKKPDCPSNYTYLGVRNGVALPALIEKLTGLPKQKTLPSTTPEPSINGAKEGDSSCPGAADEDKANAVTGEQEGQSIVTEATEAAPVQEIQATSTETTVSEAPIPTESAETASKQEIQAVSNEEAVSKNPMPTRIFSVETPTEAEITEARFLFKFSPLLSEEKVSAKRPSKNSNGNPRQNTTSKRGRGKNNSHFQKRRRAA